MKIRCHSKKKTHLLYNSYELEHALNLPYFTNEIKNKKLLMQIYHVTQCYSYYTPLGALGVIQKLNLKTRAKSEYLVPFDMFFFSAFLKRERTQNSEKKKNYYYKFKTSILSILLKFYFW